jgi:integral membrane sensor domain MASE1
MLRTIALNAPLPWWSGRTGSERWAAGQLLLLTACVFGAALGSIEFPRSSGSIAAFWPANAIVVAALLRDSRSSAKRRCSVVLGAFVGLVLSKLAARDGALLSITLPMASVAEITATVWLVNRFVGNPIDLRRPRSLVLFILLASGIAPIAGATIGATAVRAAQWLPWSSTWPVWYAADALGMIIVAPFALSLNGGEWRELQVEKRAVEALWVFGLVLMIAVLAAYYRQFMFVVVPAVFVAIMRFGVAGAATATFLVGFVSSVFLIKGWGAPPCYRKRVFPSGSWCCRSFWRLSRSGLCRSPPCSPSATACSTSYLWERRTPKRRAKRNPAWFLL